MKDRSEKYYSVDVKEVESESSNEAETTNITCASSCHSRDEKYWEHQRWKRINEPRLREVYYGLWRGNIISLTDESLLKTHNVKAAIIIGSLSSPPVSDWLQRASYIPRDRQFRLNCASLQEYGLLYHLNDICDFIDRFAVGRVMCNPGVLEPTIHSSKAKVLVTTYEDSDIGPTIIFAHMMRNWKNTLKSVFDTLSLCGKEEADNCFLGGECIPLLKRWRAIEYDIWENKENAILKDLSFKERYIIFFLLAVEILKLISEAIGFPEPNQVY